MLLNSGTPSADCLRGYYPCFANSAKCFGGGDLKSGLTSKLGVPLGFGWGGSELPWLWGFVGWPVATKESSGFMVDGVATGQGP